MKITRHYRNFLIVWLGQTSSLLGAIWQTKVPQDIQGRVFSVRILIGQVNSVISMILSGLLADYVFTDASMLGSDGASGFLSQLMGNAPGRQYAMVYILSALGICFLSLLAIANRNVRQVDAGEEND